MNICHTSSSPVNYSGPSYAARGKTSGTVPDPKSFASNLSGNRNVVVYPTVSIYCHSASVEYDMSLNENEVLFGSYYEDGSALQIYKSKEYTREEPLMDIYTRNPDGEWNKETINAKEIHLENCSFAEMRAAVAYLWESGVIKDQWTCAELCGVNEDNSTATYDDLFTPQNWVERVARWMQYQIDGGEYAAYKRFACLYSAFTNYI